MPVGRRRTKHKNLPPRMHLKRGRYYYGRNQEFLGENLADAIRAWAEREAAKAGKRPRTFKDLADEYRRLELPKKAPRTQTGYLDDLEHLLRVFGPGPLEKFAPSMIRGYLDKRIDQKTGRIAKTRADREIALFSAIWNWGRDQGCHSFPNPCTGVKRHNPPGRDRYVTDDEFSAVWDAGDLAVRDALALYLLTGQRVADVLRLTLADVHDGALWLRQGKTRKALRLLEQGELAALLADIRGRKFPEDAVVSLALIRNEAGQPLTYDALFNRFEKARTAAGIHFQLRDLRAKAATDMEDLALAQKLLGHSSRAMTEHYVKHRVGEKVSPLLRTPRGIADKKNGAN
jgi:integrase